LAQSSKMRCRDTWQYADGIIDYVTGVNNSNVRWGGPPKNKDQQMHYVDTLDPLPSFITSLNDKLDMIVTFFCAFFFMAWTGGLGVGVICMLVYTRVRFGPGGKKKITRPPKPEQYYLKRRAVTAVFLGLFFICFSLWAYADKCRFSPLYDHIMCTSPLLVVPYHIYMGQPGMQPGWIVVRGYDVIMECDNPNELDATMKKGSGGDVLLNGGTATAAVELPVGTTYFVADQVLKMKTDKQDFRFKMDMDFTGALVGGTVAAWNAEAAQGEKTPAVPMYFTVDSKTDCFGMFTLLPASLFFNSEFEDLLPTKYCGIMVGGVWASDNQIWKGVGKRFWYHDLSAGGMSQMTVMACRDSFQDIVNRVPTLNRNEGPRWAKDHDTFYVDNIDPNKQWLHNFQWKLDAIVGCVLGGQFLCGFILVIAGLGCTFNFGRVKYSP
jgi:hypothetical protein